MARNPTDADGFRIAPTGTLLSQRVELKRPDGFAYERSIAYGKDFHTHDRLNIALPRGSSVIRFGTRKEDFRVDASSVFLMAAHVPHTQATVSTVYDNLALFPSSAYLAGLPAAGITPARGAAKFRRSKLLDELANRFFMESVMGRSRVPELYAELVREALRIATSAPFAPKPVESVSTDDIALQRAIQFVEANLFSPLDGKAIAKHAHVSVATLYRTFARETKMKPFEYIRGRRLDEALSLLRAGEHSVTDVAYLVGYQDLTAFSKAFRKKFGRPPSKA